MGNHPRFFIRIIRSENEAPESNRRTAIGYGSRGDPRATSRSRTDLSLRFHGRFFSWNPEKKEICVETLSAFCVHEPIISPEFLTRKQKSHLSEKSGFLL